MNELGTYTTRSGQQVGLRFIKKDDAALLVDLFDHLSSETKRLRFNLYITNLPKERIWQEASALSDLDPQRQVAVVATVTGDDGQKNAVGVARFARDRADEKEAEVAIVVRDDFQRQGLGKHLLITLANIAGELGITHFTAWVKSENVRLMKLIKGMELKNVESETRHGETRIRVPIT